MDKFGVGNSVRTAAAILTTDPKLRGTVSVTLEGGEVKRAETGLKLYPGESVTTGPAAHASLSLFDGTTLRMDEESNVLIVKSVQGQEESKLSLELKEGTLWMATPSLETFSGSIVRLVTTPRMTLSLPSRAEVVLSRWSLTVFSADGLGVEIDLAALRKPILIGEGQQYTLPAADDIGPDPYTYRSPLDPTVLLSKFVEDSRRALAEKVVMEEAETNEPASDAVLTVDQPKDGITVSAATAHVSGEIGKNVTQVRINGYQAVIDAPSHTFSLELALADEDKVPISIEALGEDGSVLAEAHREILRNRKPPEKPSITSPAQSGQTYQTLSRQLEISGKAPPESSGIIVNDYRLQLFDPGDETWNYIASTEFGNYHLGENVFEVRAINEGGYVSEPSTLKVLLVEEGEVGVMESGESEDQRNADTVNEEREKAKDESEVSGNLPDNDPLKPGTLKVTAPGGGSSYTTSEKEFLLEGTVPTGTKNIWVNGYRLQLFEPGKETWNYIASTTLETLRRGENVYHIVARDEEGQILDILDYTVTLSLGR